MPKTTLLINKKRIIQAGIVNGANVIAVQLECPESDNGRMILFPACPVQFSYSGETYCLYLGKNEARHHVYIKTGSDYILKDYTSLEILNFQDLQ